MSSTMPSCSSATAVAALAGSSKVLRNQTTPLRSGSPASSQSLGNVIVFQAPASSAGSRHDAPSAEPVSLAMNQVSSRASYWRRAAAGSAISIFSCSGGVGEVRQRTQARLAGPRLRRRASPRRVNDPDRHVPRLLEIASEEVADGREVLHRLGRTDVPLAFDGGQRRQRFLLRDAEVADPRVVGRRDLLFPVVDRLLSDAQAELPLHVRLAAGHPDLADENVAKDDLVRARDRQRERAAGRQRRQAAPAICRRRPP